MLKAIIFAQFLGASCFAGMAKDFPVEDCLRMVNQSPRPATSVVYGSFGDSTEIFRRYFESNAHRPHILQVHLSNEVCRRNNRCQPGDFLSHLSVRNFNKFSYALIPHVAALVDEVAAKVIPLGNINTILVFGMGLEEQYDSKTRQILVDTARSRIPWALFSADHAVANGPIFIERHGASPNFRPGDSLCIANEDGFNGATVESSRRFRDRYQSCFITLLWRARHQGRVDGGWVPYDQRQYEISDADVSELGGVLKGE